MCATHSFYRKTGLIMTVLVTGSRGSVGSALVGLLHAQGLDARAASSHPDQLTTPEDVPRARCDLTDPTSFPAALAGIDSVFLYAGASHIDEFLAEAAKAGVRHIVLLSSIAVIGPDAATSPVAESHIEVENALAASPITATVLRPGAFAGNAKAWSWPIKAGGSVSVPYPGAHTDPLDERDIADVALAVLTRPELAGRAYTLGGPESLTFEDQAACIARVTGVPVAVEAVSREEWKDQMAEYLPGHFADALLDWWQATDGVPVETTRTVEELTGHPARPFAEWVAEHAAEFKA